MSSEDWRHRERAIDGRHIVVALISERWGLVVIEGEDHPPLLFGRQAMLRLGTACRAIGDQAIGGPWRPPE